MRIGLARLVQAMVAVAWLAPASFMALDAGAARAAGGYGDCAYKPNNSDDMATFHRCAMITASGALRLAAGHMDKLSFDNDGLAAIQVGKLFYYITEDGRSAPVAGVEGHAVEFHEGLAPSPRIVGARYKIGYIDKRLRLVIPARWDGGLDFSGGRAEVCRGCTIAHDGEFEELQGGQWGCIDADGREVVPVNQPTPDDLNCSQ